MEIISLTNEGLNILRSTGRAKYLCRDGKYVFVHERKYQPIRTIEPAFEGSFDEAMDYHCRNGITAVRKNSDWFFLSYAGAFLDKVGLFKKIEKLDECSGNFIAYGDPRVDKRVMVINPISGKIIFCSSIGYEKVELISNPISESGMFMIKAFWHGSWGIVDIQDKVRTSFKYKKQEIDKVSHQALKEHWDQTRIDRDISERKMVAQRYCDQNAESAIFKMGIEYGQREIVAKRARSHNNP
ncbi:MAG: hypothetical protein ACKN9J_04100 [Holophagaceae bacterium]